MINVIKRDETVVAFDKQKIIDAVNKAFIEVSGKCGPNNIADSIASHIEQYLQQYENDDVSVEDIQDLVEEELTNTIYFKATQAYIRYRYKKEIARKIKSDFFDAIGEKLQAKNVQNQNANLDEYSFGGRIGEASSLMNKQYALDYLVSDMARKNHEENMIYIHDLDAYAVGSHNCLSIPFDKLLAEGFTTRQTDVRPAGSVNTAMQLVAVIFQLQSLQQFGGVSATHLDWTMVPYVRKSFWKHYKDGLKYFDEGNEAHYFKDVNITKMPIEPYNNPTVDENIVGLVLTAQNTKAYTYAMDMTEKEIHQAAEALYHNLNTLQSRSGNQLPFTSINFGTCTLIEGRMISKALLEVSIEGLGSVHRTSIFPCGIFQLKKGVNREPGDPNYNLYQLALKSTARRLYPNYANCDWSGNAGYDENDPKTYFSTINKTVA